MKHTELRDSLLPTLQTIENSLFSDHGIVSAMFYHATNDGDVWVRISPIETIGAYGTDDYIGESVPFTLSNGKITFRGITMELRSKNAN